MIYATDTKQLFTHDGTRVYPVKEESDPLLNPSGEIKMFYEVAGYGMDNNKPKPKERPKEGDGRKTGKGDHKGDWGPHKPIREKPADRNKDWKPWKRK